MNVSALIRQPSASDDRFPIASVAIVAALALAVGLWLAHAAMGHPAPQIAEAEAAVFTREPTEGESESESESEGEGEGESEGESESESGSESESPTPTTPPAGSATRVVHGRLAYLRCDGAPQLPGPFPCPRDSILEDAVWAAIDRAAACDPRLPPGQADLVVEYQPNTSTAPTITTRDTFADDAVRTDAAAIVTCLAPLIAGVTTTLTGDRIRVGFRFTLE